MNSPKQATQPALDFSPGPSDLEAALTVPPVETRADYNCPRCGGPVWSVLSHAGTHYRLVHRCACGWEELR